jgi:hypothetical protein
MDVPIESNSNRMRTAINQAIEKNRMSKNRMRTAIMALIE